VSILQAFTPYGISSAAIYGASRVSEITMPSIHADLLLDRTILIAIRHGCRDEMNHFGTHCTTMAR
jgi:hypothetical protein